MRIIVKSGVRLRMPSRYSRAMLVVNRFRVPEPDADSFRTDLATAVEYGVNAFAVSYASPDAAEGLRAFLEKRAPNWTT